MVLTRLQETARRKTQRTATLLQTRKDETRETNLGQDTEDHAIIYKICKSIQRASQEAAHNALGGGFLLRVSNEYSKICSLRNRL